MPIKVMDGQEKTVNGSVKDIISLIIFKNGKKLGFNGSAAAVEFYQKKSQQ